MGDALGTLLRNALPRTPTKCWAFCGALAQLGERLICIQEVIGSIPIGSTIIFGTYLQAVPRLFERLFHRRIDIV